MLSPSPGATGQSPDDDGHGERRPGRLGPAHGGDGEDGRDGGGGGGGGSAHKRKRGKYIARACLPCQQRKIKCEGGQPCAQCAAKNRVCIMTPRASDSVKKDITTNFQAQEPVPTILGGNQVVATTPDESPLGRDLLARVTQLERQLRMLSTASMDVGSTRQAGLCLHRSPASTEDHRTPDSLGFQSVLEPDGQTFAGEASLDSSARSVLGQSSESVASSAPFRPSSPPSKHGPSRTGKVRGWLERMFAQHGLYADQAEWRRYLRVFFEEVHILYPFLNPYSVWQTFDEMWEYSALWDVSDTAEREQKMMAVALVCICLALGRCNVSTRMEDADGAHSAGWTLYSAGIRLVQDMPEPNNTSATSLLGLQISVVRVMYLFRLDAGQKAARLLAGVITNAHIAGLHRRKTLEDVPVFYSQLFCRLWWAVYAIDRRLALESGRPYIIQDSNIDAELPLPVSYEWINRFAIKQHTAAQVQHEIVIEIAQNSVTVVPYIETMIRFYGIVGRAWPLLYGVETSNADIASVESLDNALSKLISSVPRSLLYRPEISYEEQFEGSPRWKVKQAMLVYTFCSFLRLLIRRPYISRAGSAHDELKFSASCLSLAGNILIAHDIVKDEEIKYSFPYIHYLISATMVMSNLLSRHPNLKQQYEDVLHRTLTSLNTYCYKVWVSGKLMRTVSELNLLVQRVLADKTKGTERYRSKCMEQADGGTAVAEESEWHQSSDAMEEEVQQLHPRPCFLGDTTGSGEPRDDQSISLSSRSGHHRFPVSAMADFDFESMIMGRGSVPVTYPPNNGRAMTMMYGHASPEASNTQMGVYSAGHMTMGDAAIYRPLIPYPNFDIGTSVPQGVVDPYRTGNSGFEESRGSSWIVSEAEGSAL